MLSPLDFKVLRKGLVPLGSGIVLALFLTLPSQLYYASQNDHAQTQKRLMLAAQSRLNTAQESTLIIKQYLPRYEHYLSRGIIGNEHRLTWIDALRSWTVKHGLKSMQYAVDTRRSWSLSMIPASGEMEVRRSTMQASVNVLHEGDFFDFWDHLNRQALGLYTVKECEFHRIVDKIDLTSTQPTLATRCLIHWLTVDIPGMSQG